MGLDIYLKWDDMTEEDAKAQITGFNINSGHKGYLRASYNETMCVELGILHKVFENEWNDKGKNVPLKVSQDRIQEVIKIVKKYILEAEESGEVASRIMWGNSLINFFTLAYNKKDQKPTVHFNG